VGEFYLKAQAPHLQKFLKKDFYKIKDKILISQILRKYFFKSIHLNFFIFIPKYKKK